MKPKYYIGEIVRMKATGEKVKIDDVSIWDNENIYWSKGGGLCRWYEESELKPYCPSRTGKYRNKKGQFMSLKCYACDKNFKTKDELMKHYGKSEREIKEELAQEQREHFNYEDVSDSKQRNYQKKDQQWFDHDYIIKSLERIEKKIDELRRKV